MSTAVPERRAGAAPESDAAEASKTNIRDIFEMFATDQIDEQVANEMLKAARRSRHNIIERFAAHLALS